MIVTQRLTLDELMENAAARLDRLTPEQAWAAAEAGAVIVDVRSELHRARDGVVPGSIFHPRNVLEWRVDRTSGHSDPRIDDPEVRLVLLCNEGFQTVLAAAALQDLGYGRTTDVIGGFQAWRAAELPVERL